MICAVCNGNANVCECSFPFKKGDTVMLHCVNVYRSNKDLDKTKYYFIKSMFKTTCSTYLFFDKCDCSSDGSNICHGHLHVSKNIEKQFIKVHVLRETLRCEY